MRAFLTYTYQPALNLSVYLSSSPLSAKPAATPSKLPAMMLGGAEHDFILTKKLFIEEIKNHYNKKGDQNKNDHNTFSVAEALIIIVHQIIPLVGIVLMSGLKS